MYVQADIANLPFGEDAFTSAVSLHTIHHLPDGEHRRAFLELVRTLEPGGKGAVVYSWGAHSPLMRFFAFPINWVSGILQNRREKRELEPPGKEQENEVKKEHDNLIAQPGTFTFKHDYDWIKDELKDLPGLDIRVWRSVSTAFLRAFIHRNLFGRLWLRMIYLLEEIMPRILGRFGQYPLILLAKPDQEGLGRGIRDELER